MFNSFLHGIAKAVAIPFIFILSAAGFPAHQAPIIPLPVPDYSQDIRHIKIQIADLQLSQDSANQQNQNLGGTNYLPQNIAFFQTSLASGISSTASTMTLVSATYNNGVSTLASSTYAFVLDEGTATQEMVQADCTATACTNMTRGLDFLTGTSSVTSLKFAHRRGASVKITTAPTTLIMGNILAGTDVIPGPIKYSSSIATSTLAADRSSLASAGLVADTAFAGAGVINATTAAKGTVEIATAIETASSTPLGGSGATVVIPASNATSSWSNASLAALKVVVTKNDGTIDGNFITTLSTSTTLTSTTTFSSTATSSINFTATSSVQVGAFPVWQIGKQHVQFTSNGTFVPPRGIAFVCVQVVGGGGGGGGSDAATVASGGGAGAGYAIGCYDVSATTSIAITIGAAGSAGVSASGGSGGTSFFSTFASATGGQGGTKGGAGVIVQGSDPGIGSGGNILNGSGQGSGAGFGTANNITGGFGGASLYGGGGRMNPSNVGLAGASPGSGGSGGSASSNGGAGAAGQVIITW